MPSVHNLIFESTSLVQNEGIYGIRFGTHKTNIQLRIYFTIWLNIELVTVSGRGRGARRLAVGRRRSQLAGREAAAAAAVVGSGRRRWWRCSVPADGRLSESCQRAVSGGRTADALRID